MGQQKLYLHHIILASFAFIIVIPFQVLTSPASTDFKLEFVEYNESDFDRLLAWEAPMDIQKNYVYFLSGYDDDGTPIWVSELGKWDVRKAAEGGTEYKRNFQLYQIQYLARIVRSAKWNSTEENPRSEFSMIVDMGYFGSRQISSPAALELHLWGARQHAHAFRYVKQGVVINSNYVFSTLWNLMQPILGPLTYRVHIFGSDKNRWLPHLRKQFPLDQLPDWLGGSQDHKPLLVYGLSQRAKFQRGAAARRTK